MTAVKTILEIIDIWKELTKVFQFYFLFAINKYPQKRLLWLRFITCVIKVYCDVDPVILELVCCTNFVGDDCVLTNVNTFAGGFVNVCPYVVSTDT